MFLRPRFFRGLAAAAVLGVGLAACHEDVTIPVTPTISANPQSITLDVGQSQRIVASLTGVDGGVSFESLNPTVASVTADGLVTGLALGPATIRVYATSQPTLQTGVAVTVSQTVLPPTDSARVMIQSVTTSQTINPVDPDSVVNTIDITMSVERGQADKLQLLVNGNEVTTCTQTFGSTGAITVDGLSIGAAEQSVVCSLDTRAFDRVGNRGVPKYPNGSLVITAKLLKGNDTLDQAQTGEYTLWNSDRLDVEVASIIPGSSDVPRDNVIGDGGLLWLGNGDLRFTVVPVIYSTNSETGSGYPAQVTIDFEGFVAGNATDKASTQDELEEGGFVITFPKSSGTSTGSANLNTGRDGARLNVSSVTQGGQPGPATVYSPFTGNPTAANRVRFFTSLQSGTALLNAILRFDNEAPQAGRLILPAHPEVNRVWARNGWVNDQVNFFTAKDGAHDSPFINGGGSVGPAGTSASPSAVYGTNPSIPGNVVHGVGQDSTVIYASLGSDTLRLGARASGNTGGTASSAALTETLTNSEWAVWARVWDKLGNVSTVSINRVDPVVDTGDYPGTSQTGNHSLIGVDLVAPDVELLYSDTTDTWSTRYNPVGDTISVWGLDTSLDPLVGPSGIAVTRLQNRAYSCTASVGECMNVPGVVDGSTILATPGSNAWSITQSVGVTVTQFDREVDAITAQAYHDFRGKIFDRAGNESAEPTSALFIRDTATPFPPIDSILPLVSNVNIPPVPLFSGSETYSFSATVGDNVDVRRATAGFDFTDGTDTYRLPFANIDLTAWGKDHIVRSKLLNQDLQYIRQLSVLSDTVTADTVGRPTFARFVAFDHSNWIGGFSTQANNIVPNTWDLGGTSWFSPMQFASWHEVSAGQYRFTIGGPTGTFQTPFSRVLFYVRLDTVDYDDLATPLYYLIGAGAPPAIQDGYATIYRVFRYAIPTIPTEIVESGRAFTVVAVGINATGDALLSTDGPTRLEILGDAGI